MIKLYNFPQTISFRILFRTSENKVLCYWKAGQIVN